MEEDIKKNKDIAAASYFLIFSVVILFTRKDSEFIQFHAKQASLLFLFGILFAIMPKPLSYLNFIVLSMAIAGIIQANQGKFWKMPFISDIIKHGVSVSSLKILSNKIIKIISEIFKKQEEVIEIISKKSEIEEIKQKINFLEKQIIIQKLNKSENNINLEKVEDFVKKIEIISDLKCKNIEDILYFKSSVYEVFIGDFKTNKITVLTKNLTINDGKKFGGYLEFNIDFSNDEVCSTFLKDLEIAIKK